MEVIKFGGDAIVAGQASLDYIENISCKAAMIVTSGPYAEQSGQLAQITNRLEKTGAKHCCFDAVEPNPEFSSILKGAELAREFQPDWIIGLGGGSALDAAKGIWVFYENPQLKGIEMDQLRTPGIIKNLRKKAHLMCIPTTSGTGSETTASVVLSDSAKNRKFSFADMRLIPDVALLSPALTSSMNGSLTANTGMDALTHAIEAYVSREATDFTDALAEKAVQMIFRYLPLAYAEPDNLEYRERMQNASCIAGMAFASAGLGIVHTIAHAFGGFFHVPHGLANAVTLPYVLNYNKVCETADRKYQRLEALCGFPDLKEAILELRKTVNIPSAMREIVNADEIFEKEIPGMLIHAFHDRCTPHNPVSPTEEDMERLMKLVYYGETE